jgi:2,4-dichlorophenol 6-monooxygenase
MAWKLALVVQGKADPTLLDTYESERRPIGLRNCDWGLYSFQNLAVVQAGVGLIPGAMDYNRQRFIKIFEDTHYGRTARSHINRIINTQDIEWRVIGLELGFTYENGAHVPDGTDPPTEDPSGKTYLPSTRPGHRLPHAWVEKDDKVISTHDLMDSKKYDFMLITDEDGARWVDAAASISKTTNLRVGTAVIRAHPHTVGKSFYYDHQGRWAKLKEVKVGGAIIVRPDNFVAWRTRFDVHDAEQELRNVFLSLLRKPVHKEHRIESQIPYQNGVH